MPDEYWTFQFSGCNRFFCSEPANRLFYWESRRFWANSWIIRARSQPFVLVTWSAIWWHLRFYRSNRSRRWLMGLKMKEDCETQAPHESCSSSIYSRFAHFFRSSQNFNTLNSWGLYDYPILEESWPPICHQGSKRRRRHVVVFNSLTLGKLNFQIFVLVSKISERWDYLHRRCRYHSLVLRCTLSNPSVVHQSFVPQ